MTPRTPFARLRTVAIALFIASFAASPARAQNDEELARARELFRDGAALAKAGDWEGARARYEESLRIKRSALSLYSLATAQQQTGRLAEALETFRAFLAESTDKTREWEQPARDAVAILEKRVARLEISVAPAGVEGLSITIDGATVAPDTRTFVVNAGPHEVVANARGMKEARHVGVVREGASSSVALAFEPLVAAPVVTATPRATATSAPPAPGAPVLPIVLAGAGAIALAVAIPVGFVGLGEAKRAPARESPEADAARTKGIVADVVGGLGVVALGVGVVMLVTRKGAPAKAGAARPVRVAVGGVEVSF